MSVSKSFAVFSALLVENLSKLHPSLLPGLTLDTPVRLALPQFGLPAEDWEDGGRDITLRMLASHSAGIPREGYSTDFNMVTGLGKADAETIGADWAGATPEGVIEVVRKTNLMFAPGQRAAYSNAGLSILGSAVVNYYNNLTGSDLIWSQLTMKEVLAPLNMTHSFFGPVPQDLIPDVGVPGGENWADLLVGTGYDPVAGMWTSANDLTKYLHNIWLRPDPPPLITVPQRRHSLKPDLALPDGKQLVGAGWEIDLFDVPTANSTPGANKTYYTYGKSGDGGGWHAWIDIVPNLGYGTVILSQQSALPDYIPISPTSIRDSVQALLIPAFAKALTARMGERFAGWYADGRDAGEMSEEVQTNGTNTTTYAKTELQDQILYLRDLVINGSSALEGLDRLGWTADDQSRYFSTPAGVALTPAEGAGENAQFGSRAQVWRMMLPGLEVCDWFDFDGYKDQSGWSLSKVVLVESESGNGVDLHYPPYDIVLSRVRG
ncbi:beta-lactamase/transpeptidase-like protein [Trematosphaeria pertusa]|uniref:Beta-lactamase/transpeptidase-like protein n=1 Tax=Trematosphaeria pertusa TaxID=390896 RepID=A0A6A6IMS5_9PLEO|nr:beta-lactamase/transpeptidase-like protein [Trematosphaeria pertusa]KAF2251696.1 beta-lactamase/transpeptidase-like protein [Trematosphaeria pertusa]